MFPIYIIFSFLLITGYVVFTLLILESKGLQNAGYSNHKRIVIFSGIILSVYLLTQSLLASAGVFANFENLPPKIIFLPLSWIAITVFFVLNSKTRLIISGIPPQWLMYFQIYRIGVELVLWSLYVEGIIPIQMTFEGYNFDILAGILVPLTGWLVFEKNLLNVGWAIAANFLGLALLITIFIIAIRSAPGPLGGEWEDPIRNTMIAYWPMVWLPGIIAPAAFMVHVASLYQLIGKKFR